MYCSECKLRVADDSVTVCPVCQGRLQADDENEKGFNNTADNRASGASEILVEDKFSAYERADQTLDFNPKELGLQSSDQEEQAEEEEDIRALADLWEEEDIDADLEGVLAEAFSLDEANEDVDVEDDLGLELGKSEVLPSQQPPVTPANRNRSPLLLLLLIIVIGAGGASWFYLQKTGVKPTPIVQPRSQPQPKEAVVADRAATVKPAQEVTGSSSGDETAKLAATVPARDSAQVKVADSIVKDGVTSPEKVTAAQPAAATPQPTDGELEKLAGSKTEVLDKAASPAEVKTALSSAPVGTDAELVKKTEVSVASLEGAGEKTSVSEEAVVEGDEKVVEPVQNNEITVQAEPLAPTTSTAPRKEVVAKAVSSKVEVYPVYYYAIHMGSFKSQKRADRQLAMLQEKGFAAYQVEVDLKDKGVWQRVMIPGGTTRDEAKVVQKKLADLFPKEDSLIKKIKK